MLTAFIMAGGSGERFWPLSTKERPKQLLKLISDKTMIRETVDRILPIIPAEQIFIGTNEIQAEGIKAELPFIPAENIIIEPLFKDTAAAIGYGTVFIKTKYSDADVVVLASDHVIKNEENFRKRIIGAVEESKDGSIVTLGIKPSRAETGYGYIETSGECYIAEATKAVRFWEKPNEERAEQYVEAGNFLWNSGMFIFNSNTIMGAIQKHMPKHYEILKKCETVIAENNTVSGKELSKLVKTEFEKFDKISIDFGVMELADNIKVIPVDFGWNDVGSFPALDDVFSKDGNGNIVRNGSVVSVDSKNNIIISENQNRVIATVGVENLIIVDSGNGLLICSKDDAQHIKKVVSKL